MVDQPNRCQTWLATLLKIENLTKNRHVKIVKISSPLKQLGQLNMIDVHSYAPLQGPSALVHIDLFRIYMYMAYNRSCLKSYNAWFIINE